MIKPMKFTDTTTEAAAGRRPDRAKPDHANLTRPWKFFIGGHMGRLGTREEISLHQRYMAEQRRRLREATTTRPLPDDVTSQTRRRVR
jgi:hypothetical protein